MKKIQPKFEMKKFVNLRIQSIIEQYAMRTYAIYWLKVEDGKNMPSIPNLYFFLNTGLELIAHKYKINFLLPVASTHVIGNSAAKSTAAAGKITLKYLRIHSAIFLLYF